MNKNQTTQVNAPQADACAAAERDSKRTDVTYRPEMDIFDLGEAYEINLDLPGASRESIAVTAHEGVLTIEAGVDSRVPEGVSPLHAEYGIGDYRRRVRLGEDIDTEALTARYAQGVLTLTLPKRAELGPKRVEITGA